MRVTFSEDVRVDAADLSLSGVNQAAYSFSDFDYFPERKLAIWTLAAPLEADCFRIDLDADGVDPVTDWDDNVLDGEWTDSVSTFESGDGVAGGDFEFSFSVLPGDALGVGIVEYNNLYAVYNREGLGVDDQDYLASADIDGDGLIETSDWEAVMDNLWDELPSGNPAGATSDAPTTTGLGLIEIDDDAVDVALSLDDAFDDAEDSDAQLTYSIKSNSDASLFDSILVDHGTGELVLNIAQGVSGRATIVVLATDQSGLTVESTLTVDVDRQNIAPTITATATEGSYDTWIIEGWVVDPDDDLDAMYVTMIGMFAACVSVAEDGYFFYVAILDPGEGGHLLVRTADPHGADSSDAYVEVGW